MLTITVGSVEVFDEVEKKFSSEGGTVIELEHSLVSLSKWEQKFEKAFLGTEEKTSDEIIEYIKIMTLTDKVPMEVFSSLSSENISEINAYINAKMTATRLRETPNTSRAREIITSEIIYHWMIQFQIPFSCEHWHLNRLFTFIRLCSLKSTKPKKMGRAEAAAQRRELNEMRRAQLGTKG